MPDNLLQTKPSVQEKPLLQEKPVFRRKSLLQKKPLDVLLGEMEGENRLRRVLGPVQLSSLGVGATIGAGIFVATGVAAHNTAGPASRYLRTVQQMTIMAPHCAGIWSVSSRAS